MRWLLCPLYERHLLRALSDLPMPNHVGIILERRDPPVGRSVVAKRFQRVLLLRCLLARVPKDRFFEADPGLPTTAAAVRQIGSVTIGAPRIVEP